MTERTTTELGPAATPCETVIGQQQYTHDIEVRNRVELYLVSLAAVKDRAPSALIDSVLREIESAFRQPAETIAQRNRNEQILDAVKEAIDKFLDDIIATEDSRDEPGDHPMTGLAIAAIDAVPGQLNPASVDAIREQAAIAEEIVAIIDHTESAIQAGGYTLPIIGPAAAAHRWYESSSLPQLHGVASETSSSLIGAIGRQTTIDKEASLLPLTARHVAIGKQVTSIEYPEGQVAPMLPKHRSLAG